MPTRRKPAPTLLVRDTMNFHECYRDLGGKEEEPQGEISTEEHEREGPTAL